MMKRFVIQAALIAALTTGVASAQQILINAAGATFPYPMYSKWFDEYHKKFPNLAFQLSVHRLRRRHQAGDRRHRGLRSQRWPHERHAAQRVPATSTVSESCTSRR